MTHIQLLNNRLRNNIDMLTGCWNRAHVSNDAQEIENMVNAAKYYKNEILAAKAEIIQWDKDMHKDHPHVIPMPSVPANAGDSFDGCMTALKMSHDKTMLPFYADMAVAHIKQAAKERKSILKLHAEHPEYEQYK